MKLTVIRPGRVPYDKALAAQLRYVEALKAREDAEQAYLFLLEHPPVITIGRSADTANIIASKEQLARHGVTVHDTQRGGDVTYHGPGQIVGYPIVKLDGENRDVHRYLRRLEQVLIDSLGAFGIQAGRREGYTGAWVGNAKVAAIGVAISRWVTYHGFALNVAPNFEHFALINPCGITDRPVTSMERLMGGPVDQRAVEDRIVRDFTAHFGVSEVAETNALEPTLDGMD